MNKNVVTIKILVLLILTVGITSYGCAKSTENRPTLVDTGNSFNAQEMVDVSCAKELNCCEEDYDCEYIWYTGECNTPEYINKKQEEANGQNINIGEAPRLDNVTCTCETSKCITHY
ncbi:hypothetical protein CVU82_01035 [Candidatus Falkowbacteria bacterium HGW-Falkowbacteria-1]|jgi:hypothetical protein|uniref:Uncharacterized protein n=1 Tax=Candidatus Falkowbacteria bacterium HGW-Falkowbacteria-1 TaxID=2013768 RepID=A0A2N2EAM4_9BACT|nr:MAG: hypothetical protein CVU82_01035 [Candidatus Falkowbacteria bacterium HGW-Falkowbacteria-1]